MTLTSELLELSQHLQTENLFASNEREQLQRLYNNVTILAEQLNHSSWVLRRQKLNLQQFWQQGNLGESTDAYGINNQLEDTKFVDSYKVFSYHDAKYGELLRYLYDNPSLLAEVILEGDRQDGIEVDSVVSLTISSIYSNCILQEDETAVLKVLKCLLEKQVADSVNPRRLFSRTNIAFTKAYRQLCDSLFSARLFLTAALYEPIMRVLMEDEWFYDIDPDKALVRFPPYEKLKRFGEPGTPEHIVKLEQYRKEAVDKLVLLASRFINSIKSNIHCFPASIGWLISQVYRVLMERGQVSMQEIRTSCADLIFDRFICPAICDPEPFGITSDVPISHISRHNLMQMAKIIQVLAISQWEGIDPKVQDLYGRFDKGCMSSVLDLFFQGSWDEFVEQMRGGGGGATQKVLEGSPECAQSCVLVTSSEIKNLVGFLRTTVSHVDDKTNGKPHLETLLSALPSETPPSSDNLVNPRGGVITPTIPPLPAQNATKSKGNKKKASSTHEDLNGAEASPSDSDNTCSVLVVSIRQPSDCPGMLAEKKVLSSHRPMESKHTTFSITTASPPQEGGSGGGSSEEPQPPLVAPNPEIQEKRTRFSLSHDQESIGNASDYQEVISEAASSHSVEDEEENELEEADNFSDMISANVSGRGSPSISGRDTPLSQAGSVEENPVAPQLPMPVPVTVRKENRVDVTDRFGKFEIKAELVMERDEFQSTVSDTWSTDVLASDSEPPESNQVDRLEEVAEEIAQPPYLPETISEISETASDAWSTDVLASDTDEKHSELLKDLEQDLLVGGMEREGDGGSVGQDEGEEHHSLDSDHLGAVGGDNSGGGSNTNTHHHHHHHRHSQHASNVTTTTDEAFPDVFSEPQTPSSTSHKSNQHDDLFQNIPSSNISSIGGGAGSSGSGGRKSYSSSPNITTHSSTSLQLPPMSTHRQSSPRNFDSHRSGVGFTNLHDVSSSQSSSLVHSSTGARSKVKDKDSRSRKYRESNSNSGRGSLGSGGGGVGLGGGRGLGIGHISGVGIGGVGGNEDCGSSTGGVGGTANMADFDPLSSGGSGGSCSSNKGGSSSSGGSGGGGRGGSSRKNSKGPAPLPPSTSSAPQGLDMSDLMTPSKPPIPNTTSTPSSSSARPDSTTPNSKLRNSGSIDIWVSSNGQVSGNSTQHSDSTAVLSSHSHSSSFDSNSDAGFPPSVTQNTPHQHHQHSMQQTHQQSSSSLLGSSSISSVTTNNRTSLETNLNFQSLQQQQHKSLSSSSSSMHHHFAATGSNLSDSGLASSSSIFRPISSGSTHPLEMENSVFVSGSVASTNSSRMSAFSESGNFMDSQSSKSGDRKNGDSSNVLAGFKPVDFPTSSSPLKMSTSGDGESGDKKMKDFADRKQRTNSSEIFKKIPLLDDASHADTENMKLAQQQNAGLTERRFSAALTMFDPFPSGLDDNSMDIGLGIGPTTSQTSSSSHLKDFPLRWDNDDDANNTERDSGIDTEGCDSVKQPNGLLVVVESKQEEEECGSSRGSKLLLDVDVDDDNKTTLRPRRDSSGSSSHSASSLKGNVSQGETGGGSHRESGGDNVSMISDEKEFPEEDASGVTSRKQKATSGGFLRSVRDKFHKVKKKSAKFEKDLNDVSEGDSPTNSMAKSHPIPPSTTPTTSTSTSSKDLMTPSPSTSHANSETTDDILAKYRTPKKPTSLTKNNNSLAVANNNILLIDGTTASGGGGGGASGDSHKSLGSNSAYGNEEGASSSRNSASGGNRHSSSTRGGEEDQAMRPFYNPKDVENCPAFQDAKRKLRLVLSNALVDSSLTQVQSSSPRSPVTGRENELTHLLKKQLAEAINLQFKDQVAQLYEVVRCVRPFDLDGCKKLVSSMKSDYKSRSPYIAYLIRCRNNMLAKRSHLQRFLNRINRDKEISRKHLANMSAQKFLDKREKHMWKFISEFKKLTMADEKIDLLQCFLDHLYSDMIQDDMWKPASEQQLEDAKLAIERFVMSRIYTAAMFPNGEGDIMRDQLLQEHLNKLSQVISPSHKDIRIPPMYHMECPWPAAQREIFSINAYKTPKDKIQCVLRCSKTILNLLSLANHKSVPAADDFLPVLILVLIKANPFGLLSTIQYVNSFYGNRLHGEEHYWWMQLTSAVEFIKNMNYSP